MHTQKTREKQYDSRKHEIHGRGREKDTHHIFPRKSEWEQTHFLISAAFTVCMCVFKQVMKSSSKRADLNIYLWVLEPEELWLHKQISCHFLQTH